MDSHSTEVMVYVVTQGVGRDKYVVAIFGTAAAADACCTRLGDEADIEVFPLDPAMPQPTMPRWTVHMAWDGRIHQIAPCEETLTPSWRFPETKRRCRMYVLVVTCLAPDEAHAITMCHAYRAELRLQEDQRVEEEAVYAAKQVWHPPVRPCRTCGEAGGGVGRIWDVASDAYFCTQACYEAFVRRIEPS